MKNKNLKVNSIAKNSFVWISRCLWKNSSWVSWNHQINLCSSKIRIKIKKEMQVIKANFKCTKPQIRIVLLFHQKYKTEKKKNK
jgi:hypothetical protein